MMILCTFQGADDKTGTACFNVVKKSIFATDTVIKMEQVSRCLIRRLRKNRDKVFCINPATNRMTIINAR